MDEQQPRENYPDLGDPQAPLPSGRMPKSRFTTPIRTLKFGESFVAPKCEIYKVQSAARRYGRLVKIEPLDDLDCRVTILSYKPVAFLQEEIKTTTGY